MAQAMAFGPMDGVDGVDGVDGIEGLDTLGGGPRQAVFRPMGLAPEFKRRADEVDYRAHRWPPRPPDVPWPPPIGSLPAVWPAAPGGIARRLADFTPDNSSLLVLAEFVQLGDGQGADAWTRLMTPGDMAMDIVDCHGVPAELDELRRLAQYRGGVMAEALAQRNGIIGYFRGLLQFNLATHPYTYHLAAAALRVGQFLCMHYKGQFNRPRPNRLDPSVMSPIDPPGHSSYPSGHSLQSFLIAHCLEQVVPAALGTGLATSPYMLLAERIAKLREVLGVHYPSDTAAGRRVAGIAFPLLMHCPLIRGTPIPNAQAVPNNVIWQIGGQAVYDNGWFGRARAEWEPR